MNISFHAIEYMRVLAGETIPMSWDHVGPAYSELERLGLAEKKGFVVVLTGLGISELNHHQPQAPSIPDSN